MTNATLGMDFFTRLKAIEDILVLHPHFVQAVTRIAKAIEFARQGVEPRHTLLLGESGTGKTWVGRHVEAMFPLQKTGIGTTRPILFVGTPAVPTLRGLGEAILVALHDPLSHRGTASDKRERALRLLAASNVECIIFDEFQQFLDNGHQTSLISVTDWLKCFIDDVKIPCVLIGLPRCEEILQVNEQLRRRFSSRITLPPFSIATEEDELGFRTILNALDKALQTEQMSGLAEINLARRLYFATNGLMGYLRKLITTAFELMVTSNRTCLNMELLEDAFTEEIWNEGRGILNPFSNRFQFRPLTRPGEPFALDSTASHSVAKRAAS